MFIEYNRNTDGNLTTDCTVRAIAEATDQTWERTYIDLCVLGYSFRDMPNADKVWSSYLRGKGFRRYAIPNTCPDCYTVRDFCADHPTGTGVLAVGGHVIAVRDGDYIDTWDSGDEVPMYYYMKEEKDAELL